MINRRILRIKAMQSIYAFKQNEESDFNLSIDKIKSDFRDELNIKGKVEAENIKEKELFSIESFRKIINEHAAITDVVAEDNKSYKIIESAVFSYKEKRKEDYRTNKLKMLAEAEGIYKTYLEIIEILIKFGEEDENFGLAFNRVLKCLRSNYQLSKIIEEKSIRWETGQVRSWLKLLKKEEEFYPKPGTEFEDFESERAQFRLVVRDFLFKNEVVISHFEEDDLNWSENKSILRSMVINTIRELDEEDFEDAPLYLLSKNWEEDKVFFQQLYEFYVAGEVEYEKYIEEKSKKWSVDRIAAVDKILIKLAICEMINFPNIPVKVSINEYIEVAKNYSTPKSAIYINGMLDEISKKLQDLGKIRKSGRGLIDNK